MKTKIILCEKVINSVSEQQFNGAKIFGYTCEDGSCFYSQTEFKKGARVSVYLFKFENNLRVGYDVIG